MFLSSGREKERVGKEDGLADSPLLIDGLDIDGYKAVSFAEGNFWSEIF